MGEGRGVQEILQLEHQPNDESGSQVLLRDNRVRGQESGSAEDLPDPAGHAQAHSGEVQVAVGRISLNISIDPIQPFHANPLMG